MRVHSSSMPCPSLLTRGAPQDTIARSKCAGGRVRGIHFPCSATGSVVVWLYWQSGSVLCVVCCVRGGVCRAARRFVMSLLLLKCSASACTIPGPWSPGPRPLGFYLAIRTIVSYV